MFLAEPGRFKGLTKLLPSRGRVGGEMCALQERQRMNRGCEGTNRLLDALIGRRQLELGVERLEVMAELLSERQHRIDWGRSRFRHSSRKYDTGKTVVATTYHPSFSTRRFFYEAYSTVCPRIRCRACLGRLFVSPSFWDGRWRGR